MINYLKNIYEKISKSSEKSREGKKATGGRGEKLAASHYKDLGFRILEMNYSCKLGELDIIAQKGKLLVFSEVKTRKSMKYGPPELAVDKRKRERIKRLAKYYIKFKKLENCQVRFDVISIIIPDTGKPELKHIESAF